VRRCVVARVEEVVLEEMRGRRSVGRW